ncbi:two-component system sensor histidine kinase YesM [Paenibacillus phyllosphaerae]|uniref:histidine kinase n=1 Tax=Paenibacillus phyllosphaerae TaxID=274593 RepID=A0A7W5AWM5_9BACL|nr:histidine kinase [Paenibacillus phyllosphaerae]MBB3109606.1 two-component system sensor histidine kinase YesM [Paenibacillus phyllosphaerae]
MRRAYRNYIKNNWFIKLILVYASIAVLTIVTLSYFAYFFLSRSVIQSHMEIQLNAMSSIDNYFEDKYDAVQRMMQDVYRDQELSDNVSFLLKNSYEDYIAYRLDKYLASTNGSKKGLEYFLNLIEDDPDIKDIILYSTDGQFLYMIDQHKQIRMVDTNAAYSYVPDAMLLQNEPVTKANDWVLKSIGQSDSPMFAVHNVINDMMTYQLVGQMLVLFNSEGAYNSLADYADSMPGYILVLTPEGDVLFDSSGRHYGKRYPYDDSQGDASYGEIAAADSYLNTLTSDKLGYRIVGITPRSEMAAKTAYLIRLILLISTICLLIAIIAPTLFVVNFAKRVKRIIRLMRRVETGDMTVRIKEEKEDELGQISRGFNDMMDELSRYIDREYKSEIKQKQAELAALQARVHPHFLYNTLEVIRMRALSLGAHDVSDMIYSLAGLFRSFVQQQSVVTFKEEIDNCRKYLELFRIRYKDRFTYEIDIDPGLAHLHVAKMSLQPIVENVIVHGLQSERDDNKVEIRASLVDDSIRVIVKDNGQGIPRDRLEAIRNRLHLADSSDEAPSFGLRSVVERLHLMYGKQYGLEIDSDPGNGTTVTVWSPAVNGRE